MTRMARLVLIVLAVALTAGASPAPSAATERDASGLYNQMLAGWDPATDPDGINLCYRGVFLMYTDVQYPQYEIQQKACACAELILGRVQESGIILRYTDRDNVNSKLMTGLGAWALSTAYWYTGDERYAEAARLAGDYLIADMDHWEATYPAACDDPRTAFQRNGGNNETCLTSYCYTSPNDLGLVALGTGAIAYYGAGGEPYYSYTLKLADATYDMQLADGSWHDGYALKIPTRWDRSCHYVTMAMMGLWMGYKISGDERYAQSLTEAWAWYGGMQAGSGAVYDIWVDGENLYKAPGDDNPHDFLQVDGQTDEKAYFTSASKTYLGEFSFMLAASLLSNVGLDPAGSVRTADYLGSRMVFSNWYVLSYALAAQEPLRVLYLPESRSLSCGFVGANGSPPPVESPFPYALAGGAAGVLILAAAVFAWRMRR